jgi:hypothetical protein
VRAALRRGVALWSEVEFATRFLPNRVAGITGTNGKTTTTELTGAVFRDAGLPVAVGGNIGHALAAMPGEVSADATLVVELSSFQLEHIERFRPALAVLLNLTEDHLDRHGTYRAYVDAKLRIFENQTPDDLALVCADDDGILAELAAGRLGGRARRGSPKDAGLLHVQDLIPPVHGQDDLLTQHHLDGRLLDRVPGTVQELLAGLRVLDDGIGLAIGADARAPEFQFQARLLQLVHVDPGGPFTRLGQRLFAGVEQVAVDDRLIV